MLILLLGLGWPTFLLNIDFDGSSLSLSFLIFVPSLSPSFLFLHRCFLSFLILSQSILSFDSRVLFLVLFASIPCLDFSHFLALSLHNSLELFRVSPTITFFRLVSYAVACRSLLLKVGPPVQLMCSSSPLFSTFLFLLLCPPFSFFFLFLLWILHGSSPLQDQLNKCARNPSCSKSNE